MKTIVKLNLWLLLLCMVMTACNDERQEVPCPVTITQYEGEAVIKFLKRTTFEQTMKFGKPEEIRKLHKEEFLSYAAARAEKRKKEPSLMNSKEDISSEMLAEVVNSNGIFQAGEWIFRIDKANEKVYAIHYTKARNYKDLIKGNLTNPDLLVFSTDDDVFEYLEAGGTTRGAVYNLQLLGMFCGGGAGADASASQTFYHPAGYDNPLRGFNKYSKYGVYFELVTELRYGMQIVMPGTPRLTYDRSFHYKTNCKNYREDLGSITGAGIFMRIIAQCVTCPGEGIAREVIYGSTRGLDKYELSTTYYFEGITCPVPRTKRG